MYPYQAVAIRSFFKLVSILGLLLLFFSCSREEISQLEDDGLPPATPVDLKIYASFDGTVEIIWKKNNEPDINNYRVYRSTGTMPDFAFIGTTTDNYFISDSLEYDSTYSFKITAVDYYGRESKPTSPISTVPKNIYKPYPPQPVLINARNWPNQFGIKLVWAPPIDNDIKYYEIYRSTSSSFQPDSANYLDFTPDNFYFDTKDVKMLTQYYYKIRAVDRGKLTSQFKDLGSDMILDEPIPVSPSNNSILNSLNEFRFITVSKPARYKLIISYEALGTIKVYDFYSDKTNTVVSINAANFSYDAYRTYSWKITTFTADENDPNSIGKEFLFTIRP